MSPFPYSDAIDAPILEARKLMLEHHVRHLPVTRDHELKGIITDRDIKLLLGPELDYPNPREMTVTGHGRLAGIFTERCVPRSRRVAARTFSEGRRRGSYRQWRSGGSPMATRASGAGARPVRLTSLRSCLASLGDTEPDAPRPRSRRGGARLRYLACQAPNKVWGVT